MAFLWASSQPFWAAGLFWTFSNLLLFPAFSGPRGLFWTASQPFLGSGPPRASSEAFVGLGLFPAFFFWASGFLLSFFWLLHLFHFGASSGPFLGPRASSGPLSSGPLPSLFWASGPLLGFLNLFPAFSRPGASFF